MNEIITAAGIAVIAAGAAVLLKQYKPEYAFGVSLAAGAAIIIFVMFKLGDIIGSVEEFVSLAGISNEHYKIMLRCLGVCMITKITSETCKDCGQGSISTKIDMAGKIIILAIAMPLFSEIMSIVKALTEIR